MNNIKLQDNEGYTLNRVSNKTELSDIIEHISRTIYIWKDKHCVWDLNLMDFSKVDSGELKAFINTTASMTTLREGNKTAFVVKEDFGFGMLKMLESLASDQFSVTMSVFRSMPEALKWLKE